MRRAPNALERSSPRGGEGSGYPPQSAGCVGTVVVNGTQYFVYGEQAL
jgi:hypothetical protein